MVTAWVVVGLAGLWLVVAPLALGYAATTVRLNDLAAGAALALTSIGQVTAGSSIRWSAAASAAIGAWLISAPFVLDFRSTERVAAMNDVLVGATAITCVLAVVAGVSLRHSPEHGT